MAKGQKIFKIVKLIMKNGLYFGVGETLHLNPAGPTVEEITFNRADKAFNGGLQMPGASYTIHLSNETRTLVPFDSMDYIEGAWVPVKTTTEDLPELPEA